MKTQKLFSKKVKWTLLLIISCSLLICCDSSKNNFDASGVFEAEETIISAEATGVIRQFDLEEGQVLTVGQLIGYIDSTQLYLKKKQLESQIRALLGKKPNIGVQLSALQSQLKTAETERIRFEKLVAGGAAPSKQLDDINAQIEVLQRQIAAQKSTLDISSEGIDKDIEPLKIQVEQLEDQLAKCRLVSPQNGTVLAKIAKVNELTAAGKPLYKIADLQNITLRAFVTSAQLTQLKIGQKVKVFADFGEKETREYEGVISWISDKSEFTPKTIQTQDERANLVYAVKITVKNDGYLKIGMYGQVQLQPKHP
ncbi:MAG: HlyD family efflux transporter periplasmic adaptor subunit [Bacteroidetes bacterium]|nr:HlyD family efflux transporter periplasmic adaptor subunit [Bacteroidota bacterium]MCL2328141.1 HlyD family efflux transporter periplasmic adaptor subunit [Bacteroidota bacterium]